MRWWERLFYAHDPEARRMLDELHSRFTALERHIGKPDTAPAPTPIRLDCGHEDIAWGTDSMGITYCRACLLNRSVNER